MIAANYTEFRKDLKKYLDRVENDQESLVLKRGTGKGTIVFSIDEYNSIMEIMHLLKSKKNTERLFESIDQIENGKSREIDSSEL
ncbi:MAG: type II toxin-antitoxin system prevent-host-death family antitoxin [Gracilimonas sp.]|nr:type II toxin-antitoxin system prevent-host-death family antitoxin [Gracilimonas sp.]